MTVAKEREGNFCSGDYGDGRGQGQCLGVEHSKDTQDLQPRSRLAGVLKGTANGRLTGNIKVRGILARPIQQDSC